MTGRTLRISVVAFLALVVAVTGGGLYVLNLVLSDNLAFRQGDFAYIIVTTKTVRDFPRFAVIGEKVYFKYSARDGTAPGQIVMTYDSTDTVEDLERKHRAYCQRQDYPEISEDKRLLPSRLACDAFDYRIEIDFRLPRYNATSVRVVFLERRT